MSDGRHDRIVGKVDAFAVAGCDLWFNSDNHLPPHFHAESAEGEARVYFLREPPALQVKWGRRPRSGTRQALVQESSVHRLELLEEWQRKVHVRTPGAET
jgi:hypothetical protein